MGNKWKKYRGNKTQQLQSTGEAHTPAKTLWRATVVFSVLSGIFVTIYALAPKIIVTPSTERIDPANPMTSLFNVTNDGLLPIYSVKFLCELKNVQNPSFDAKDNKVFPNRQDRSVLNPGEGAALHCGSGFFIGKIHSADIALNVSFRPAYWFLHHEKHFAFRASVSSDGVIHWMPKDYES